MRFRDDILRGLRVGLLLLAGVLVAFTAHRFAEAPRLERPAVAPEPAKQPAVTPVPLHAPSQNATQNEVPPPPARSGEGPRVKRSAPVQSEPAALAGTITPLEDFAEPRDPSEKPQTTEPLVEPEVSAAHSTESGEAAAPAAAEDAPAKTENRGKRWLKAVGHFLHITRSSPQQQ